MQGWGQEGLHQGSSVFSVVLKGALVVGTDVHTHAQAFRALSDVVSCMFWVKLFCTAVLGPAGDERNMHWPFTCILGP